MLAIKNTDCEGVRSMSTPSKLSTTARKPDLVRVRARLGFGFGFGFGFGLVRVRVRVRDRVRVRVRDRVRARARLHAQLGRVAHAALLDVTLGLG